MEIKKIEKLPDDITVAFVEAVVMPNGEVISGGKTLGWFNQMKEHLFINKQ